MRVDPNKATPRPWIADAVGVPHVEPDTVRAHAWALGTGDRDGLWVCSRCGVEVDKEFPSLMGVSEVVTDLSLDIAVWIYTTRYPRTASAIAARRCPRIV